MDWGGGAGGDDGEGVGGGGAELGEGGDGAQEGEEREEFHFDALFFESFSS